jgi:DNA-binding NtrC family response regulator
MMKSRILIVDDEKEFVEALSERLTMRDYDVSTAFSGEDAISKVKGHVYDVVILDVSMPGLGGVETLQEIKKIKPLTEVIMLTGHATVDTAISGLKLGAREYLLKPCDTQELIDKIDQAHKKKTEQQDRAWEEKVKEISSSPRSVLK